MKRRILLVDDEVAVLLTLKAVLEISGFDVETAASAREGVSRLHTRVYHMLITDMRMESDAAGVEVIKAARAASYHPAIALLTAFPVSEEDWQEMGADQLLVKPMHTRILLKQIDDLLAAHERKLAALGGKTDVTSVALPLEKRPARAISAGPARQKQAGKKAAPKQVAASKTAAKKLPAAKVAVKKPVAKKAAAGKFAGGSPAKSAPTKKAATTRTVAKKPVKKSAKKTPTSAKGSRGPARKAAKVKSR